MNPQCEQNEALTKGTKLFNEEELNMLMYDFYFSDRAAGNFDTARNKLKEYKKPALIEYAISIGLKEKLVKVVHT